MTKKGIKCGLFVMALLVLALPLSARTRTTRSKLQVSHMPVEVIKIDPADSASIAEVNPEAISLRGFSKRKSDSKESFLVTNNTNHRLSAVRLLMRYTTLDGQLIHERTVTVPVELKPGETKLTAVKTFDVQRMFYYYAGPKPRKEATPFKVAYRLVGYDIPVGN